MQPLTAREAELLEEIRRSIAQGVVPSVRELSDRISVKSTSTVHRYLTSLEEKGYIVRESNCNRNIRLADYRGAVQVPIVGQVAAGAPILAAEEIEDYLPVDLPYDADELFALRIRGESMVNAGILDGDLVIVRRCSTARNGEIVVALLEDEATVKRFYKEDGRFRLQPENDEMEPIYTRDMRVLGVVVALQRFY